MRQLLALMLLVGVCLASPKGKPQTVTMAAVYFDQSRQEVTVVFKSVPPPATNLSDPTKWTLVVSTNSGVPLVYRGSATNAWTITGESSPRSTTSPLVTVSPNRQYAVLALPSGALTGKVTSLLASFDSSALFPWSPPSAGSGQMFSAASNKSTSDNYLSGTYSPALHSAAQYTIDGKGSLVEQTSLFGLLNHWRLTRQRVSIGATATVATDNRPTADPDSYLVSGLIEWAVKNQRFWGQRAQGVLLNWDFAGLEFDRKTTTKTFISSPVAEIPIRLSAAPKPGSHFFLGMFPYFGVETGTNLSNAINSNGSGFLLRGLLGSSVSLTETTNLKWLPKIEVSCNYTARVPTTNEIFTNTHYISETGKTVSLPVMSSQVRHHVTDELDLTVAKPFSITIKHEYGELPPGFRTVDNKITIGLTVMLQQNNTPHSKIDPTK